MITIDDKDHEYYKDDHDDEKEEYWYRTKVLVGTNTNIQKGEKISLVHNTIIRES